MKLTLIEPLKDRFKDEVRKIGRDLGMPEDILHCLGQKRRRRLFALAKQYPDYR